MHPHTRARWMIAAISATLALAATLLAAVVMVNWRSDDLAPVRQVVQSQLRAFERDDASEAFALADPGVRSKFDNADQFMAMVRAHYPMVHRPASVLFLQPETDGETAFQRVRMTDQSGTPWLVTYLLHRQQDRQWRISACLVVPDTPKLST